MPYELYQTHLILSMHKAHGFKPRAFFAYFFRTLNQTLSRIPITMQKPAASIPATQDGIPSRNTVSGAACVGATEVEKTVCATPCGDAVLEEPAADGQAVFLPEAAAFKARSAVLFSFSPIIRRDVPVFCERAEPFCAADEWLPPREDAGFGCPSTALRVSGVSAAARVTITL